jgi:hypothetical protein
MLITKVLNVIPVLNFIFSPCQDGDFGVWHDNFGDG